MGDGPRPGSSQRLDDRVIDYRAAVSPPERPRRTRWWLIVLLLILTPFALIVLMILLVAFGFIGPD